MEKIKNMYLYPKELGVQSINNNFFLIEEY